MKEIVVFSHVRWNCVCRRPQQILTRLARSWRVLFIEEPLYSSGDPRAALCAPQTGVTVMTPHTPLTAPGFHDAQIPLLQKLVGQALSREGFADYGAWLYTPMALPLLQKLSPRIVVYDCMEEPSASKSAPRQLLQRENALMRVANVVFTVGSSLFDARRSRHANVHLFPNSVEREHFARAGDGAIAHPDIKALARPRLGFFGVLDERLDVDLLRAIGERRPEWEICIVGPVRTIDPLSLPRLPNLHYLGHRRYDDLPALLAGWDLAILPFARDEAMRFISPTQTLEYMAAGRSIVSTSIREVKRLYGNVVRFADTPDEFIAACEAALVEPDAARAARLSEMRRIVASTSWDETACGMRRIVARASRGGLTEAARIMFEPVSRRPAAAPAQNSSTGAPCVILGAGSTGLSAAFHYGEGSIVLERETKIGGGCRSFEDTGFTFDHAGHVMFSCDPFVQDLYRLLLGDNVHWQEREAWIYSDGAYARYPSRGSPPAGLRECLEMSWIDGCMPLPDPDDLGEPALQSVQESMAPNARFGYPLRGGFQALMNGFLPLLRGELRLQADVERVSPLLRTVRLKDGRRVDYDTLISTLPLPVLIASMGDEAPPAIRRAASELRHMSIRCVNLGVARPHLSDKHWIHFPGGSVFHRVFLQGNASPHCNPPGGFGLTCEIGYSPTKPLSSTGAALTARCIEDCIRAKLLDPSDALLTSNQVDIPYAHVIRDRGSAARVALIRDWLANFNIILAGRYAEWQHHGADHAFAAGKRAVETARRLVSTRAAAKSA